MEVLWSEAQIFVIRFDIREDKQIIRSVVLMLTRICYNLIPLFFHRGFFLKLSNVFYGISDIKVVFTIGGVLVLSIKTENSHSNTITGVVTLKILYIYRAISIKLYYNIPSLLKTLECFDRFSSSYRGILFTLFLSTFHFNAILFVVHV